MNKFETELNNSINFFMKIMENGGMINGIIGDRIRENKFSHGSKQKYLFDFWFLYKGTFYALECKSTVRDFIPFSNIESHQIENLKNVERCGGKGFFLFNYRKKKLVYALSINHFLEFMEKKKSLSLSDIYDTNRRLVGFLLPEIFVGYTPKGEGLIKKEGKVPKQYKKFGWDIGCLAGY